jgi:hypothetical protein
MMRRRKLEHITPVEWLARAGYAARGLVYLGLGASAVLAAIDARDETEGMSGVLGDFARWPLGPLWLALLGAGLAGFVLWRLAQAAFDADRQGRSHKAIANRVGQAISGLVYAGLALTCVAFAVGLEEARENAEAEQLRTVLALPWGELLLLGFGAGVLVAGGLNVAHGVFGRFRRNLDGHPELHRWTVPLARAGYTARGLVFLGLGVFLAEAALALAPAEAATVEGALQALEPQPFGSWLLIAAGLGLAAFGAFGLVEAFYRRIIPPEELRP